MIFKDHFSKHAGDYAESRPHYPDTLFEYLTSLCQHTELAWDCATGNGQAASGLTPHFKRIIATDASGEQLSHAITNPKIDYLQTPAEQTPFQQETFDLIVVAQALHWFDMPAFFIEANRVLKKDGVIAVWSYEMSRISNAVDAVILHYYNDVIGDDWPPERKVVATRYRNIEFPFIEIKAPQFQMRLEWTLEEYLNYLYSWSGTRRYLNRTGKNPLDLIRSDLAAAWKQPEERRVITWPLNMRAGYKD